MKQQKEKAGPVATGTDLRQLDLAIGAETNPTPHDLQVRRLTRRAALSLATATILAPMVFGEVQR